MPRRNLKILLLTLFVSLTCYLRATRNRYAPTIADAIGCVADYYIEPVERRRLYEGAMEGMVGNLDEYSSYIGPDHFKELQEELDQEFGGVGIEVGLAPDTERLMVLSPIVDSPGFLAGMRAGDLILEIDGAEHGRHEAHRFRKTHSGQTGHESPPRHSTLRYDGETRFVRRACRRPDQFRAG